jgi:hypothetical protein
MGQLNRAKPSPQVVNSLLEIKIELISPPKIKGRVYPFTKANMTLRFPTFIAQLA